MRPFVGEGLSGIPRQEMPRAYRVNGALYLSEVGRLRKKKSFIDEHTKAYVMPQERSLDIDDALDHFMVECFIESSRS